MPMQHIDFDSLPISKYTGLPYDPELISYPYGAPKPKRKFRLFRRREKPRPKQEHVSAFEVCDGPYTACEHCAEWQEVVPKVEVEVFHEREQRHTHFISALREWKYPPADRVYISKCIDAWADGKSTRNIQKGVL